MCNCNTQHINEPVYQYLHINVTHTSIMSCINWVWLILAGGGVHVSTFKCKEITIHHLTQASISLPTNRASYINIVTIQLDHTSIRSCINWGTLAGGGAPTSMFKFKRSTIHPCWSPINSCGKILMHGQQGNIDVWVNINALWPFST